MSDGSTAEEPAPHPRSAGPSRDGYQESPGLRGRLGTLREGPQADYAFAVAWLLAVLVSTVHWGGLVAGGALVGVLAPSFLRALQRGFYVGVGVLGLFAAYLAVFGALGTFLGMGQITLLTAAMTLAFPLLGASVRALG